MTLEEARKEFELLQNNINDFNKEVEVDAHLDFINSLKQYVNKY